MIRQQVKLSNDQSVEVSIHEKSILIEVLAQDKTRVSFPLSLNDMEELTDLMIDSFYKAGIEALKSEVRNPTSEIEKEVSNG